MRQIFSACKWALLAAAVVATTLGSSAWSRPSVTGIYSSAQLRSGFDACTNVFPDGRPVDLRVVAPQWRAVALCSDDFAVVYSGLSKTPLLVVEKLSRQSLKQAQSIKRSDDFFPDTRAKRRDRADLRDYKGSGYDRGHMAAAANRSSVRSMLQSFALSNMVPQHPTNNRKIWNKLERDTRRYVMRAKGDVFVFSGPLFDDETPKAVGKGRVWVPSHLFKLVVDPLAHKVWAHLVSNDGSPYRGPPLTYEEFVARTGWDPLPGR